jgi:hypothetical protein
MANGVTPTLEAMGTATGEKGSKRDIKTNSYTGRREMGWREREI